MTRLWALLLAASLLVLLSMVAVLIATTYSGPMVDANRRIAGIVVAILALAWLGWPAASFLSYSWAISRFRKRPGLRELRNVIAAQRAIWMALGVLCITGFLLAIAVDVLQGR